VDLEMIAREAEAIFEDDIRRTGVRVEIENMPVIHADRVQMLHLFQNLIGNALKFRRADSPRIKIEGKYGDPVACEVYIEDNGIGFDPKHAERIFKPFQRLHTRNEYEGTGMGLAICRRIVEQHGGSIRVESQPGKGSTFIVRLRSPRRVGRREDGRKG
jgi:light-regulated signal transduction histidine kinase (bacteriophytochrome)